MTLHKAINESELRLNAFAEIDHELISEVFQAKEIHAEILKKTVSKYCHVKTYLTQVLDHPSLSYSYFPICCKIDIDICG